MNISEVIISRMRSFGLPKARVAELIDTTPTQFGRFLDGKASLTRESMNKCFEVLDIDLMIYKRRDDLAREIAVRLKSKNIDNIVELTKEDIIALTGKNELSVFAEVNKKLFEEMKASVYVDVESTYNYMKELITHYLIARDINKITFSEANRIMEVAKKEAKSSKDDSVVKIAKKAREDRNKTIVTWNKDKISDASTDTRYNEINKNSDWEDRDDVEELIDDCGTDFYDGYDEEDDNIFVNYSSSCICKSISSLDEGDSFDTSYECVLDDDDLYDSDFDDEVGIFGLINKYRKKRN